MKKIILKSIVTLIIANVIWIIINAYVELSFEPIINRLISDQKEVGYRVIFITANFFIFFAIMGYFLPIENDNDKLTENN